MGGKGQDRAGIGTWKAPQPDQIIPHPAFFFFLSVLRGATSPHLTNHDAKQDLLPNPAPAPGTFSGREGTAKARRVKDLDSLSYSIPSRFPFHLSLIPALSLSLAPPYTTLGYGTSTSSSIH